MICKHWKRTLAVLAASAVTSGTASAQILGGNVGGGVSGSVGGALNNGAGGAISGAANAALNGGTGQQILQQGVGGAVRGAVNGAAGANGVGANVGGAVNAGVNGSTGIGNAVNGVVNGAARSALGASANGSANVAGQALNLGAATRLGADGNLSTDFANQLRRRFTTSTRILGNGPVELSERLPAELRQMGFRPGDVLLNEAGKPLRSLGDVKSWVAANGKLNVLRDGKNVALNLASDASTGAAVGAPAANIATNVGLATKATSEGLVITDVTSNSVAAQAGLQAGDQVVSINGQAIADQQALNQALRAAESAATVEYLRGETRARANVNVASVNAQAGANMSAATGANETSADTAANVGVNASTGANASGNATVSASAQQRTNAALEQRVAELERLVAELRTSIK